MGSRERKRAERKKRKRRSAAREAPGERPERNGDGAEAGDDAFAAVQAEGAAPEESFQERMAARSEARNADARAKLEPLADGERPGAVTAAAIVSGVLAVVFTGSAVVALVGGVEIDGNEPSPGPLIVVAAALWLMTHGLLKARYWAVLGFQMLLLLVILSSALGLVQVSTVPQVIATLALLGGAGTLFYFTIRAMARLQMPDRPGGR
ncbi:hypothetical protein BH20ACT15_BH20ACT15_11980 [soil metagenome]